jgi:hypothetical protein
MPDAPQETKGYKSILKLSDWLAGHRIDLVSKTPCLTAIAITREKSPTFIWEYHGYRMIDRPRAIITLLKIVREVDARVLHADQRVQWLPENTLRS